MNQTIQHDRELVDMEEAMKRLENIANQMHIQLDEDKRDLNEINSELSNSTSSIQSVNCKVQKRQFNTKHISVIICLLLFIFVLVLLILYV